mmetsp:Transcript_34276/g.74975  ORF Transcript_34276/g.74975 Transcript_34276/m.74975 type:complete len:560 (-) Transcript_34276:625-2304(-)
MSRPHPNRRPNLQSYNGAQEHVQRPSLDNGPVSHVEDNYTRVADPKRMIVRGPSGRKSPALGHDLVRNPRTSTSAYGTPAKQQMVGTLASRQSAYPPPVTPNRPQFVGNPKNVMFIQQRGPQHTPLPDNRPTMKPETRQEVRRPGKQAFLDMQNNGRFSPAPGALTPQTQVAVSSSMSRNALEMHNRKAVNPSPEPRNGNGLLRQFNFASKEGGGSGFRSEVMGLEKELQDRLRQLAEVHGAALTAEHKLPVYGDIFEAIINKTRLYGGVLRMIKQAYEGALIEAGVLHHATAGAGHPAHPAPHLSTGSLLSAPGSSPTGMEERVRQLSLELKQAQADLSAKKKRAQDLERKVEKERAAVKEERRVIERDYASLQSALEEREQDIRQLGQIIVAVQKGDIGLENLRQLDLNGGLYSERSGNSVADKGASTKKAPAKKEKSAFDGVPPGEITWEISLSSREPIKRPEIVPALNLKWIAPPRSESSSQSVAAMNAAAAQRSPGGSEESYYDDEEYSDRPASAAPASGRQQNSFLGNSFLGPELSKEKSLPTLPSVDKHFGK